MLDRGSLSPLDGRYAGDILLVTQIFNERSLVERRVNVELRYLQKLLPLIGDFSFNIDELHVNVDRVFEIERITHHDVKAVEMAIKEVVSADIQPFVHFGLTSQDINSVVVTSQVYDCVSNVIVPSVESIETVLTEWYSAHHGLAMLSHTHGQPATPSSLGHQFAVFADRLGVQLSVIRALRYTTKFGGATGGFNAHCFVYPNIDWCNFGDEFINDISDGNIDRQTFTTQIEHYDGLCAVFDAMKRVAVILTDLCSDIWHYISLGYLRQLHVSGSIGSSTMPHKINPILFENAEGNFGLCIALFEHMSRKLPISRLQRDLTDSTVTRNIGVAFGHLYLGISNIIKGLRMIEPDHDAISADLERHPEVLYEAYQCALRSENITGGYDDLRAFSLANPKATLSDIRLFLSSHYSSAKSIDEMMELTPESYRGI